VVAPGPDPDPGPCGGRAIDEDDTFTVEFMARPDYLEGVPSADDYLPEVQEARPWRGEVLRTGDVLCAAQKRPLEFEHRNSHSWGTLQPDEIRVAGTLFCVEVVTETDGCDGEPGWLGLRFTEFQAELPSYEPKLLKGLSTGRTTFALRSHERSGVKFQPSTGIVVVAVRGEARNSLFRGTPVPLDGFLTGRIVYDPSVDESRLDIIEARFTGMTPETYQGPRPVD
jgi:hypothetical protein